MTDTLLGDQNLPEELRVMISQKTEGNPFFLEEVVKSIQESRTLEHAGGQAVPAGSFSEILAPDTVQDVIMARIDRLGEEAHRHLDG